jgi:hypothetical protein
MGHPSRRGDAQERCGYCGSTQDLTVELLGGHHSTATILY